MNVYQAGFKPKSIHDTIVAINGIPVLAEVGGVWIPTPKKPADLAAEQPQFFTIEENANGVKRLCCSKILDRRMTITYSDGTLNYDRDPEPFEPVYYVNGHPSQVPIFRPK